MSGRLRVAIATLLTMGAVGVPLSTTTVTSAAGAATPPAPAGFSVQLGSEQRVFGPSHQVDMPFHTAYKAGDRTWRGFIANGDTSEVKLSSGGAFASTRIALARGPQGRFDQCGAWLTSVYVDPANPNHWLGWYHAEAANNANNWCDYSNGGTRWSMAFAESTNAGGTWTKPGYPNNQVITQDRNLTGPFTEDAGNGRVVVKDGYFYMFFQAATAGDGARKLNIARAPLSSSGRPGKWSKCSGRGLLGGCSWGGAGLGGPSMHLPGIPPTARSVVWNSYLQRWVAVAASGRYGFSLWQSKDLLTWETSVTAADGATMPRYVYPLVNRTADTTVDRWSNRRSSDKGVYGYSSLVGLDLSSTTTGQDMWLYYMRIFPGEGFDKRYLVRRRMSLVATAGAPSDRVQLTTYVDPRGARRTSSEMPAPALGFKVQTSAGYLLTVARSGFVGLFECRSSKGDHTLRQNSCPTGELLVRRVGYAATRQLAGTTAIWRCYDTARARHFAMPSSSAAVRPALCTQTGMKAEYVIGYALPAIR